MARLNIILATLVAVLLLALAACWAAIRHYGTECDRLAANNAALTDSLGLFRTSDGLRAIQVRRLTLTAQELREQNAELVRRARTAGIRRRDIQAAQVATTAYVATVRPDTVHRQLTSSDTAAPSARAAVLEYSDPWLRLRLDTAAHVELYDTVTIIQHVRTRRFLFWTWKRYSGRATAISSSPYAHITTLQSIDIEK